MMRKLKEYCCWWILPVLWLASCSSSLKNFNVDKKFGLAAMQQDFLLFKDILEKNHPGIYGYTSKDSIDYYFKDGYSRIKDSMTEPQFRMVLSYVISKINCGHTVTMPSKTYAKYFSIHRPPTLPFNIKFLNDEAVVSDNINRKDSLLTRGAVLHSIDAQPINLIRDSLSQFISTDGYNTQHKWQTLNSRSVFFNNYSHAFTTDSVVTLSFTDTLGRLQQKQIKWKINIRDTAKLLSPVKPIPKKRLTPLQAFEVKGLMIDTTYATAYMVLNSFSSGNHLKKFFRKSFKTLAQRNINNLIIDVRYNGGGNIANSNFLTRLLINKPYKIADSLYAVSKTYHHGKYIQYHFWQWPLMSLVTHKSSDGNYHFGFYERHYFHPKTKNHFNGKVFVITGYNSFSATAIFANTVKGQPNILLVGEETGGAQYGNNAWLLPEVTLPNTKLRFVLPKFHLVSDGHYPKTGHGVPVDIEAVPTKESIQHGIDVKRKKVGELLRSSN